MTAAGAGPALAASPFDAEIFGVRFLRLLRPDPEAVAAELGGEDPATPLVVSGRLPVGERAAIAALGALGFRRVTTLVELVAPAGGTAPAGMARGLTLSGPDLAAHAEGFVHQRYRQDPLLPAARAVALMRAWIANSLAGRRETLATGRNFVTFAEDVARDALVIDLVSCLDRGEGAGGRLMAAIRAEAALRGRAGIHVATEAENVAALRLYTGAGFRPVAADVALHLVRHPERIGAD